MEKKFDKKNDELKIKKKKNFKNELFKKKKVIKKKEEESPKDDYIVKPLRLKELRFQILKCLIFIIMMKKEMVEKKLP